MSRGYGRYVAALGLALLIGSPAASQKLPSGQQVEHHSENPTDAAHAAEGQQHQAQPAAPEQHYQPGPSDTAAKGDDPGKRSEGPDWTDIAQALSALVVMAFTGFLSWLSWRQHLLEKRLASDTASSIEIARKSADAAGESARAAHESVDLTRAQLRAYIEVTHARHAPLVAGEAASVEVRIANGGQTRAMNVRRMTMIGIRRMDRVDIDDPDLSSIGPIIMGSGQQFDSFVSTRMILDDEIIRDITEGRAALFSWGLVDYEDIFGQPHFTRFRLMVGGDVGFRPERTMLFCQQGNEAD